MDFQPRWLFTSRREGPADSTLLLQDPQAADVPQRFLIQVALQLGSITETASCLSEAMLSRHGNRSIVSLICLLSILNLNLLPIEVDRQHVNIDTNTRGDVELFS